MSLHIEVVGNGPALVLIHGWALHGGEFAPLVDRLAAQYQLHLVDLPGHGFSHDDATPLRLPHVVNAIAAATPPAVWCGWSLGAGLRRQQGPGPGLRPCTGARGCECRGGRTW